MSAVRVAIAGCGGRMGQAIVRAAAGDAGIRIAATLTHAGDSRIGQDAGGLSGTETLDLPITTDSDAECDVLIEFTNPAGCMHWTDWCVQRGIAFVSGTTGLSDAEQGALLSAAGRIPVVWSANMSIGINLLLSLVEQTAARLGDGWDVEIVEAHHRRKIDAPSGTARALLAAVQAGREEALRNGTGAAPASEEVLFGRVHDRRARRAGEIGVHAVRMGDVVGEHDVHFAGDGEVLTLRHSALSRSTFAAGALRAAKWVVEQRPHLYDMRNVLGFA